MRRFLDLYQASDHGTDLSKVNAYHHNRLAALIESEAFNPPSVPELALRKEIKALQAQAANLHTMLGQEAAEPTAIPQTPKFTYEREVHEHFVRTTSLRTPAQWKETVFEDILQLPLDRPLGEPAHWEDGLVLSE